MSNNLENTVKGRFGEFGGQYIPETLMNEIHKLEAAYEHYKNDPAFTEELTALLNGYAGRPSLLYPAEKMTRDLGGAKVFLKREDLNHTGSHKINNVVGQVLLAKKMGFDPAVMSSPFITTLVDAMSLLIYFNFARTVLHI